MAIMEQFPTPEKSLPRCLSLVNGYLFLLVRNDDLGRLILTTLSGPRKKRSSLFYLVPKVDGIGAPLSRCMMLSQAMDLIKNRNAMVNKKASDVDVAKGLLWTKCRPTLNHTNGTSSICRCILEKGDFQVFNQLCYTFADACRCSYMTDVTDLRSMLVFHTESICISLSFQGTDKSYRARS